MLSYNLEVKTNFPHFLIEYINKSPEKNNSDLVTESKIVSTNICRNLTLQVC